MKLQVRQHGRRALTFFWGWALLCGLQTNGITQMVTGTRIPGFAQTFGVQGNQKNTPYSVALIESSAPGNILWPGEQPKFTFQIVNNTDQPIQRKAKAAVVAYGTKGRPGDVWVPDMFKISDVTSVPFDVNIPAKGFANVTLSPKLPAKFGAYALVTDLGPLGRQFVTSCVRTFAASSARIQYPKFCLDDINLSVLKRLGVQAVRYGVSYKPTTDKDFEAFYANEGKRLKALQDANIAVLFMIGAGDWFTPEQPLQRPRPWLTADGVMMNTKTDIAWMPSYDDDFQKYVKRFAAEYGWPRGPINAFSLWNEPWEGISISGWGADMLRYREIYTHLALAVEQARQEDKVDILVGGCDSTSNAMDKLFGDGSDEFLKWFDFCSIHYQGLDPHSTMKQWVNRKGPHGRVKIWDTESWVANTDDRVAAVVAANRAAGYDRAMGIYGGNIAGDQEREIRMPEGKTKRVSTVTAWPVAASVGASQHFIGERDFKRLLFLNGLPWVMLFEGLPRSSIRPPSPNSGGVKSPLPSKFGVANSPQPQVWGEKGIRSPKLGGQGADPEDGTVVVVGDLGEEFGPENVWFRTARGLREVAHKEELRKKLAALPATGADKERAALTSALHKFEILSGATMTLTDGGGRFALYDFYGNVVPAQNGKIVVPLDGRGFFLRGNGQKGSFAALVKAVQSSRIEGIESLATVAHDLTARIENKPSLRLSLTNVLNRPVTGKLSLHLGKLQLQAPPTLTFKPNETKEVLVKIVGGQAAASNIYPLALRFDAGKDGVVVHDEDLHVNVIPKRTITVDGNLDDWKDVPPQTVTSPQKATPSLTEAAWFPFKKFDESVKTGFATGYLAYDDRYFYFAAKVADSTPDPGMIRFATRDDDEFYYPETSYLVDAKKSPTKVELVWPAGVRRYSYRKDPELPSGNFPNHDNIQIAFNVLPPQEKPWYPTSPGTMPGFICYKDTDYEYALNPVAPKYGGGVEIWRLEVPGMPHKHFYPRQGNSPKDGPVADSKLVITRDANTRLVEAAIPWTEIPDVKKRLDAGQTIKFSFRVNDNSGVGCMELSRERSVARRNGSFHADWVEHWANEVEFGFEK